MDPRLLEILVCPICKGPIRFDRSAQELICALDRLAFPVRDGIAVMLEEEARRIDPGQQSGLDSGMDRAGPSAAGQPPTTPA
jgi:uncharacterized protein YbaR (Trm112 family)